MKTGLLAPNRSPDDKVCTLHDIVGSSVIDGKVHLAQINVARQDCHS